MNRRPARPGCGGALRDDLSRIVAAEGATVFLTTHNLGEAERSARRWR